MVTVLTEVYEILRKQFGDEDAKRLMEFFQQNLVRLATKDDIAQLEQRVMTELVGKADKVDLARIRELWNTKPTKKTLPELRRNCDRKRTRKMWRGLKRNC